MINDKTKLLHQILQKSFDELTDFDREIISSGRFVVSKEIFERIVKAGKTTSDALEVLEAHRAFYDFANRKFPGVTFERTPKQKNQIRLKVMDRVESAWRTLPNTIERIADDFIREKKKIIAVQEVQTLVKQHEAQEIKKKENFARAVAFLIQNKFVFGTDFNGENALVKAMALKAQQLIEELRNKVHGNFKCNCEHCGIWDGVSDYCQCKGTPVRWTHGFHIGEAENIDEMFVYIED